MLSHGRKFGHKEVGVPQVEDQRLKVKLYGKFKVHAFGAICHNKLFPLEVVRTKINHEVYIAIIQKVIF